MKIAVTGKGGVGKTTLSGTVARLLGRRGMKILAVDADPAMNLWTALGITEQEARRIVPLLEDEDLVNRRSDVKWVEVLGTFFRMNPKVDDLADRFAVMAPDNVRLLVAGTVRMGGSGCMCPSATLLKALIAHLVLDTNEAFIMDMDAGIENLGRGTTKGMDALIVVVEPTLKSVTVLDRIKDLAADIGQNNILVVANKVSNREDEMLIQSEVSHRDIAMLGLVPDDARIREADRRGIPPLDFDPQSPAMMAMRAIADSLHGRLA